jgi:putative copper export protein
MTGDSGKALPETASNASTRKPILRGGFSRLEPLWIALLLAGLTAAALMIAAEFATLRTVKVLTASCTTLADPTSCDTKGHDEHGWALLVIGLATVAMTWGATLGQSRPAAMALAVLGLTVLFVALALDAPKMHETGIVGIRYDLAHGSPGPGQWLEVAGGALAFVTGVIAAAARPGRSRRRDRERRRRREERRARAGA